MIYFIRRPSDGLIKIGFTDNPHTRFSALRQKHGRDIVLLGLIEGDYNTEQEMHTRFGQYRVDPIAEWFTPSQEMLDFIDDNTHLEIPKDKSARLAVEFPDELFTFIRDDAKQRNVPIAFIVRDALADYYARQGRLVNTEVNWGGYRPRRDKEPA